MIDEERLQELVDRWEELREAGREVDAKELARDCPELSSALHKRLEALRATDWIAKLQQSVQAHPSSTPTFQAGSEPVPGYRLLERIGRGGFSEVWKASGPNGEAFALKFVLLSEKSASGERQAIERLKGLRHPNLIGIIEAHQTSEHLIIVMELADGTLADRRTRLTPEEILAYFTQAAAAIDFLHEQQIRHRDIKPANLLLIGTTLKVADFGLARTISQTLSDHSGSMTAAYAAPEFFSGTSSPHSDQYSLAITYCHMRGGQLPFDGTPAQVMAGHLGRVPDLSMVPLAERAAIAKALSKKPADRWPSCTEFMAAVKAGCGPRARFRYAALIVGVLATLTAVLLMLVPPREILVVRSRSVVNVRLFDQLSERQNVRCVVAGPLTEPIGRKVAFSNGMGGPTLWDWETGKVLRHLAAPAGPCVALAPFEQPVGASGHDSGEIILWNLDTGNEIRRLLGHGRSVSSVVFSLDGHRLLSGSCDRTVRLWDVATGKKLHSMSGHEGIVMSVAMDSTGRRGLSGSWDGTVHLWDLVKGTSLKSYDGHAGQVWAVTFSPDGLFALSASKDRDVHVWNLESGQVRKLEGHGGKVQAFAWNGPDRLLTGAEDGSIRVWDWQSCNLVGELQRQPSSVQSLAVVGFGGSNVLVGTEQHGLRMCRLP